MNGLADGRVISDSESDAQSEQNENTKEDDPDKISILDSDKEIKPPIRKIEDEKE